MTPHELAQTAHRADAALDALFAPRGVAFVGASQRPHAPASRGLRNTIRLGFSGGIYPVNPKYDTLHGAPCAPSIADIPGPVDLAMIALPAEATLAAVEACAGKGVRTVVVCSSGWAEAGAEGRALAARLDAAVRAGGMRLLGPNSLGVGATGSRLCLGYNSSFESVRLPRAGRVGLVSQSGAMLGGLVLNAEDAGADLALFAHVGNGQDVSLEELASYMIAREDIDAVALMIEGLSDGRAFIEVAQAARAAGKGLIVYKAGRSELGSRAVASHTGALAGSDAVFSAVCRDEGVVRVEEPEDLLPVAHAVARWGDGRLGDGRLLVFTLSGGAASIIADEAERTGLSLPPIGDEAVQRLKAILPGYTKPANPFDVGGGVFTEPDLPRRALEIVMEDPASDAVAWVSVGAPRDERSKTMLDEALILAEGCAKPLLVIPTSGHVQEIGFEAARRRGVPVARSLRAGIAMLAAAAAVGRRVDRPGAAFDGAVGSTPFDGLRLTAAEVHAMDEADAKGLLDMLGVATPHRLIADGAPDLAAAVRATEAIDDAGSGAWALKGLAPGILHKTEHGLVALNLSAKEVVQEATRMSGILTELGGGRLMAERMVEAEDGAVEMVLGVAADAQFGPIMMVGLGGTAVELFGDVAFGRCPLDEAAADAMLDATRAGRILDGYRGAPALDRHALKAVMLRLSRFAADNRAAIADFEINPLLVRPAGRGVIALDATALSPCEKEGV